MVEKGGSNTRLVAIDVLAQCRTATANPLLFKVADDPDKRIRLAAIEALGKTAHANDMAALVTLLLTRTDEKELKAAEIAVKAVYGESEDKEALSKQLLAVLPQASVGAKCALIRLLRMVGGADALQAVRVAAKDADSQVQETAIRAMCEWQSADAASDLLEIARTAPDLSRKIAALRGYINLVRHQHLSTEQKMAMVRQASGLIERDEERKLLLSVLGDVASTEALSMAMTHLESPTTKEEAGIAVVAISEKIAQRIADTLQKVIQATDNEDVKRRAQELLNKAQ